MRRASCVLVALVLVAASAPVASGASFDPNAIVFPVDGPNRFTDTFGACRGDGCSRTHEGTDIMADKGVPVLAAANGTVAWVGSTCCLLEIDHGGGWATRYIHLNNDTQNADGSYSDDGLAWGIAPGIVRGAAVGAGQLIGWVGDSGNAEGTAPHLHFEMRKDGVAIPSYDYLVNASAGWTGQFRDDDWSVHEQNIDKIHEAGITFGCNPPYNNEFCPSRKITRGEMAAFISRALGLEEEGEVPYTDVEGTLFEPAIRRIEAAGIGFGCTETLYCPNTSLTRSEMAELLVRAFGYDNPDGIDFFVDDDGNVFEESINALANHSITLGCNPPANDHFCPDRLLDRAEMATFFVRALGY